MSELPPLSEDTLDQLNAMRGGFNELIDLTFVSVSYDEVVGQVVVGPRLHQPYGLVHGGVYATMIETLASVGAALNAMPLGRSAVGLENDTSFLRAVRGGTLTGRATPLRRGRRTQVWEVTVHDDGGRLAARGQVRMLCLLKEESVAGETVDITVGRGA
jgi:1,4-dihydroxy-2-naphthoyl-CoA hydrolase